jgi:UDP-glucose 4-epimerase
MKHVAVTGISGYVGTKLLARLDRSQGVRRIIGIDTREPRYASPKLSFYRRDVGVRHLLHLSSYTVYGAYRRNAVPLTEEALLRPIPGLPYSRDKIEAERILGDLGASDDGVAVTILRSCPVIGPGAGASGATILFRPPVLLGVTGRDPPMQFVHEDDLINLMVRLLARRQGGIYNVAGNGTLRYSQVARLLGKRLLRLPGWLLEPAIRVSWAMHLQSASPVGVSFLKYPPVVSTARLARDLGFKFRYSSREALASFARAANPDGNLSRM